MIRSARSLGHSAAERSAVGKRSRPPSWNPELQQVDDPFELRDGQDCATSRAGSRGALRPPDLDRAELAVGGYMGVGAEVEVEHRHLAAAKAVGVADLERDRVTQRREPTFVPAAYSRSTRSSTESKSFCSSFRVNARRPGGTASSVVWRGVFQSKTTCAGMSAKTRSQNAAQPYRESVR